MAQTTTNTDYVVLTNRERADAEAASASNGIVYFDENYFDVFGEMNTNGGGLAVRTEDGWGAVIATNNMQWIRPRFNGADYLGSVKIGTLNNAPLAGIHVERVVGAERRVAIFGNYFLDRTYFGGPNAGSIRGSDGDGNLFLEGTVDLPNGREGNVYINGSNGGNIVMAAGNNGGQVSIGTYQAASGFDLSVGGKIITEELVIELEPNWPDYVFDADYELLSLDEIEAYIEVHHHLPGVPSAEEVAEEGLAVGEMNRILMEKVEELTLLLIEQDKRHAEEIGELRNQLEAIEK